jgi:acetyltransferase-like isoleucine patch superfamily enzyme
MYIGRNVFINTTRVSEFDLIILEDESSVDDGATLCGHVFEEGCMKLGDVLVRQYSSVGAWSMVNPYAEIDEGTVIQPFSLISFGMYVPPETTWKGSPAVQVGTRPFEDYDFGPLYSYTSYFWTLPFVLLTWIFVTAVFYGSAFGNIRMLVFVANKYSILIAGGFLPVGLIGMGVSQVLAGLVVKRILLGRAFQGVYPVYGSHYLRRWAVAQVSALTFLTTIVISSTSLAGWYYRLWGAYVGKGTEIMSIPTLCDADLINFGRNSFFGSDTKFLCSQVKDGALHCDAIHVGTNCFIGNNSCVMGNAFVENDVVVGSMTLLDAEVYASGSTLVGSPCIQLNLRPPQADAADEVSVVTRTLLDYFFILSAYVIYAIAIAPPVLFLQWLNGHLNPLVLSVLFPPVFFWFFIILFFFAVAFKWLFVGRLDTEPHHAASVKRQFAFFVKTLLSVTSLIASFFYGTAVMPFCFRLLGAKVGRRTCINTMFIDDWDLVAIGSDVYIGENTVVQCHTAEGMVFKCLPVIIGRGCVVGKSTVVLPGAKLKMGTTLGDLSLVMKNEVLENVQGGLRMNKDEFNMSFLWEGSPAKLRPKHEIGDT